VKQVDIDIVFEVIDGLQRQIDSLVELIGTLVDDVIKLKETK